MGRAPCCEKDSVKRGPWTPEEDAKLLSCIGQYGTGSWRTLPKKAGLQRCGKSCRLRWTNYLRPDLKHGRFSDQEEQLIVKLHAALGSRWSLIAAQLPGRTDNDVKNYWNTRLKKKLCEMGIDPITHKPISQLLADLAGSMTLPKGSEIAEATLGCFKDDMLNVLMRRRSDVAHTSPTTSSLATATAINSSANHILGCSTTTACSTTTTASNTYTTTHINMSFAPLNNMATPVSMSCSPSSPPSLITAAPPAFVVDKPHHLARTPPQVLNTADDYCAASSCRRRFSCTPAPCGPVSGIRSAAGFALAGRNHAGSSLNGDPTSCNMLDMLLDPASYAQMKQVPDLNLMQTQEQATSMRQPHYFEVTDGGSERRKPEDQVDASSRAIVLAGSVVGDLQSIQQAETLNIAADKSDAKSASTYHQNERMYTLLLQQQEAKQGDEMPLLNRAKVADTSLDENIRKSMDGGHVSSHNLNTSSTPANVEVDGGLQSWSPVSYTNSGSSSSNLSLSMNPHISPLDSVLTSDALLWDLSELGSMVS